MRDREVESSPTCREKVELSPTCREGALIVYLDVDELGARHGEAVDCLVPLGLLLNYPLSVFIEVTLFHILFV